VKIQSKRGDFAGMGYSLLPLTLILSSVVSSHISTTLFVIAIGQEIYLTYTVISR
jgi:hypothetical protein